MKYISIDIETTGLSPETCQILQIGAVIEDTNNVKPINELPKFNCIIEHPNYAGEPTGLAMNSQTLYTLGELDRITDPDERLAFKAKHSVLTPNRIAQAFILWANSNSYFSHNTTKKIIVAGKNFNSFDLQFLKKLPGSWGSYFSHRVIDPAVFYVNWKQDDELPTLSNCLFRADIDSEVTHDAVNDALAVIKIIRAATKNYTIGYGQV